MSRTDLNLFRIKRLKELIDSPMYKGNATDFARKAEYKAGASYVGQLLRGERPINEKTIEKWTELEASPPGWFSNDGGELNAADVRPGAHAPAAASGDKGRSLREALETVAEALAKDYSSAQRRTIAAALTGLIDNPKDLDALEEAFFQLSAPSRKAA